MNPAFLGDSYDIVKRFFVRELQSMNYAVEIDPMFTGDWAGREGDFRRLLGVGAPVSPSVRSTRRALFLDPDTGVNERGGKQHVALARMALEVQAWELVFAFDQSFSRQAQPIDVMKRKMTLLSEAGARSMYYDSHAKFLFASSRGELLQDLVGHLVQVGVPRLRFVSDDA